ncbi:MAG: sialate O-acetylesterase [Armatimonadota bacterium]|nr:MAG: sialate O-acetylesterase [Armatimonadota bacterium]
MRDRLFVVTLLLTLLVVVCAMPGVAAEPEGGAFIAPMIQVTDGVAHFQVLARDDNDTAKAHLRGRCYPLSGAIEARLTDRGAPVAELDWRKVGQAEDGKWVADLGGLPVGGPYDLEVRLVDAEGNPRAANAVYQILVGDLWVLAGQSNMQGVGKVSELPPPTATVHMFTMDDRWAPAREPLHPLFESKDEAHWHGLVPKDKTREEILPGVRQGARSPDARSVGPGLPFGWELYRITGVPVGLIPCARGGTSLEQWSPAMKDEGGKSLYGAMLRRVAAAGGRVRGVVWYQGESDANPDAAGTYEQRFVDFVSATRADLAHPDLPFLYVQIGRFIIPSDGRPSPWDIVREAQRLAEPRLTHAAVVPAADGTLVDAIHLDTAAQMKVGKRLALNAARELFGREDLRPGPRLAKGTINDRRTLVTIRFNDVNGRLRADGRPTGFVLADEAGEPIAIIMRVDLPEDRPDTVELALARELPEGARLWYARGFDPYANLTDDQDMGMLSFGPVSIPYPAE